MEQYEHHFEEAKKSFRSRKNIYSGAAKSLYFEQGKSLLKNKTHTHTQKKKEQVVYPGVPFYLHYV